ncbi:MAG: TonB-dependent receptor, partial [Pseudomonadales bacterium]|nr:TonB-dependent receptor [Pseudomonadales bacterium]
NNPGLEAAVGTFIDGVYRSRAGLAFSDLTDIERVEVLRGPQGTLFGKNTSAGALHIITKKPEFEPGYMASLSAGDFNSIRVQASATGPLIEDKLAYRIAGSYNERDGFYEDDFSSADFAGRDRYSIKAQLLWTPTDDLESRFIWDYTDKDESCCPARYDRINTVNFGDSSTSRGRLFSGEPAGVIVADLLQRQGRPAASTSGYDVGTNYDPFEQVEEWGIQNETKWHINDVLSVVSITAYREFDVSRGQDVDFSGADILEPQNTDESFENFSQEFQFTWATDTVDFLAGAYIYSEKIRTNESVRLGSQGGEYLARLQTAGVDAAFGLPPGTFQTSPAMPFATTIGAALGTFDPVTRAYITGRDGEARGNHAPGDGYFADYKQDTDGWSLFTHNVWHVTDRFDLTFGARYSNEKKKAQTRINGIDPISGTESDLKDALIANTFNEDHCTGGAAVGALCDNVSWKDKNTEKEWTGTIKAAYALSEDMNVYASISRGYKAGGFNLDQQSIELDVFSTWLATGGSARFLAPLGTDAELTPEFLAANGIPFSNGLTQFACGQQSGIINITESDKDCAFFDDDHAFDPEFVDAYEIGFKSEFLEGALTTNVAFFYSDFEDFQVNTFTGTGFLISNTDKMVSKGVELESTWLLTDNVLWTFGLTYANAKYGNHLNLDGASETSLYLDQNYEELEDFQSLEDIEGRRITHSPLWQGSTSLFIEQPVGELYAYGNLNVGYRGKHNTGSDLKAEKKVGGEFLVNLQIGIRSADDRWDLQVWSRNLFDNQVESLIFNSVFQSGGSFSAFLGAPRMSGVTITSHF